MNFDEGLELVRAALKGPLPGEEAQRIMAPVSRKTMSELLTGIPSIRESSVLILLYPDHKGQIHSLLIERPVTDHVHSGQLAFPGGKTEESDPTPAHTALREAEEEVGVAANSVEVIGKLTDLIIPASRFLVRPHVGVVASTPKFIPNPEEVRALLPVSLTDLLTLPHSEKSFATSYGHLKAPCYHLEGRDLWGATAMMVSEFRVMMENVGK